MSETTSHTELIMWTVTFFFGGIGIYGVLQLFLIRGAKTGITKVCREVDKLKKDIDDRADKLNALIFSIENKFDEKTKLLEAKKVDVLVYVKDKDAADILFKSLVTKDMCDSMRDACHDRIFDRLGENKAVLDRLLANQGDFEELKGMVKMVIDRQKQVIDRIDRHLNGHAHT